MREIRVVIERHEDGFVAYPIGLLGVVVGEGDTAEEALADVTGAIKFHLETFGTEAWESDNRVLDVELRTTQV